MPEKQRRPIGMHLAWLLSVAIAGTFVTTMIVVTGDLASLWPLYIIPIVVAALAYHLSGAVLSIAAIAATVALLSYGAGYDTPPLPELVVGLIGYAVAGVVIGVQAQRQQDQRTLLELDSTRDELTDVLRADYLLLRLEEEVRRNARYGTSCAYVLIEVPGCHAFRRQFGRIKTELMLERLAQLVRLTIRDTDLVGRRGATCLAVVMPSTDAQEAAVVVARVRAAVMAADFEGDALEPTTQVTIEVATATHPLDAGDSVELRSVAEARLSQLLEAHGHTNALPPCDAKTAEMQPDSVS
jgi:diguanylate cyclase (GGDEF)-like protein